MATYIPVDRPTDPKVTILPRKWVWDRNANNKRETRKFKACWVVLGNLQMPGIHFDKIYVAVVSAPTTRALMALCAARNLYVAVIDFVAAFLAASFPSQLPYLFS